MTDDVLCDLVFAKCNAAFPQGSILGPLLFVIYINDLPDFCNDLCTRLYIYADDSKIYRHVLTSEDQEKLQNDMHRVTDWADEWLLK